MSLQHRGRYVPLNARTPGGVDHPVPADDDLPPLPAPGRVTVGVVDCGIVLEPDGAPHPWLRDHVDFRPDDGLDVDVDVPGVGAGSGAYLADADGHGTFVTGVVLREAPLARVAVRGALDKADPVAGGSLGADNDEVVTSAVRSLAAVPGLAVVNLSFGGAGFSTEDEASNLLDALRELPDGVAVVASAGNDGVEDPVWPAAFDSVIGVGAVDEHRWRRAGAPPDLAFSSNRGAWVDAYASGVQLLGPFLTHDETGDDTTPWRPPQRFRGWARWSGTSFAAAVVSGRIAQTVIEQGGNGVDAAKAVLGESRVIDEHGAVWVRSRV